MAHRHATRRPARVVLAVASRFLLLVAVGAVTFCSYSLAQPCYNEASGDPPPVPTISISQPDADGSGTMYLVVDAVYLKHNSTWVVDLTPWDLSNTVARLSTANNCENREVSAVSSASFDALWEAAASATQLDALGNTDFLAYGPSGTWDLTGYTRTGDGSCSEERVRYRAGFRLPQVLECARTGSGIPLVVATPTEVGYEVRLSVSATALSRDGASYSVLRATTQELTAVGWPCQHPQDGATAGAVVDRTTVPITCLCSSGYSASSSASATCDQGGSGLGTGGSSLGGAGTGGDGDNDNSGLVFGIVAGILVVIVIGAFVAYKLRRREGSGDLPSRSKRKDKRGRDRVGGKKSKRQEAEDRRARERARARERENDEGDDFSSEARVDRDRRGGGKKVGKSKQRLGRERRSRGRRRKDSYSSDPLSLSTCPLYSGGGSDLGIPFGGSFRRNTSLSPTRSTAFSSAARTGSTGLSSTAATTASSVAASSGSASASGGGGGSSAASGYSGSGGSAYSTLDISSGYALGSTLSKAVSSVAATGSKSSVAFSSSVASDADSGPVSGGSTTASAAYSGAGSSGSGSAAAASSSESNGVAFSQAVSSAVLSDASVESKEKRKKTVRVRKTKRVRKDERSPSKLKALFTRKAKSKDKSKDKSKVKSNKGKSTGKSNNKVKSKGKSKGKSNKGKGKKKAKDKKGPSGTSATLSGADSSAATGSTLSVAYSLSQARRMGSGSASGGRTSLASGADINTLTPDERSKLKAFQKGIEGTSSYS